METASPSADISAHLDALYEEFDGFDVNQTTVSVGGEEFDERKERGDIVEVQVRVEGTDGVLAVPAEDEWAKPGGIVDGQTQLSTAAGELVRQQTAVDCQIEELIRVSLVCLQSERSGDQVWRLSALFAADAESGSPAGDAAWREQLPESSRAF